MKTHKRKSRSRTIPARGAGFDATRGSKAAWIYQAIWEGGIEYERAIIESPLKVAILAAAAMADGCKQITIEPHKPLNDQAQAQPPTATPERKEDSR